MPADAPVPGDARLEQLQETLAELQHREDRLWSTAVLISLLLITAFVLLQISPEVVDKDVAVRGLILLVVVFNFYASYQHFRIKSLRKRLIDQQLHSERLYKLAMQDELTGLYNRRVLAERLPQEQARSRRHNKGLTLLLLDLDDFKTINDAHGHTIGDAVLREFSRHLLKSIRASDVAVRMGGDEFCVLLPECMPEQVTILLGRLKSLAIDTEVGSMPVRFSWGWTKCEPADSLEEILKRADRMLYADKNETIPQTMAATAAAVGMQGGA